MGITAFQKQCLLAYWGFLLPEEIDGIWGTKSSEATKRLQEQLSVEQDGVWGDNTDCAARNAIANGAELFVKGSVATANTSEDCTEEPIPGDAEKYLQADGHYHIPRGVDVQLSRNLWAHEVMCQGTGCCSESIISKRMVEMFQTIRDDYGDAISIGTAGGSGFRCPAHNAEVGGAVGSLHLNGDAFDLHAKNKAKLLTVVEKRITDGEIGTYSWGIHAGVWDRGYVNRFTNG